MGEYRPMLKQWVVYTNELFLSTAYQELNLSGRNLLHCLMCEVHAKISKDEKGEKKVTYPRNGDAFFTQSQFMTLFKCSKQTYLSAKNQLIEKGLIRVTDQGGCGQGSVTKFEVLTLQDIPPEKQLWRLYPQKDWSDKIHKGVSSRISSTSFKKGECGRKRKKPVRSDRD